MRKLLAIALIAALCCCVYTASAYAQAPAKTVIRIKGSDDMASRVNKLAYQFMQDNPNTNIVVSGGTKGLGFAPIRANFDLSPPPSGQTGPSSEDSVFWDFLEELSANASNS